MITTVALILGLFLSSPLAREITISGTVKDDSTGRPVHLAKVESKNAGISAVSDINGNFKLVVNTSVSVNSEDPLRVNRLAPSLSAHGEVYLSVPAAMDVQLTVRDLSGKTIYRFHKELIAGRHKFSPPLPHGGIFLYHIRVGGKLFVMKHLNLASGYCRESKTMPLAKQVADREGNAAPTSVTLQTSHPWYKVHSKVVGDTTVSGVEIMLSSTGVTGSQLPDPDATPPDATKPVKVYIMAGQSNMVGMGDVGPVNFTKIDKSYVNADLTGPEGFEVSTYAVAYAPGINYGQLTPARKDTLMVGHWPHDPFPVIAQPFHQVARGYIYVDRPGIYSYIPYTSAVVMEMNGKEIYRKDAGKEAVIARVEYARGFYPVRIIYAQAGNTYLKYEYYSMPGQLITLTRNGIKFPHLVNDQGGWTIRNDVWYKGVVAATASKWLTVGCGADAGAIGTELQFGHIMGNYCKEPVLLIKSSQGNRMLGWDFLPPGSVRFNYSGKTYGGYGDSTGSWPENETYEQQEKNEWYAGRQYDECFREVHKVLDNFPNNFPQWKNQGYEIAGFIWWQGHRDGSEPYASRYEINLVKLIKVLRNEFKVPNAPFVIATLGFHGWDLSGPHLTVTNCQLAMNDWKKYPEFAGNVVTVETRDFWRDKSISPMDQDYHYNRNAETYMLVGDALGLGILRLLEMRAK